MVTEKKKIRLLQLSDIVLDARLSFKGLEMTATMRHERNGEALEAVLSLCQLAGERQADAILVVGNLWDAQAVTASTVSRLAEAFAALGDTPVIICPGSTDPYNAQSFYDPGVLAAFAVRPWSKNVHIFSSPEHTGWISPTRPDICFIGRACKGTTNQVAPPKPVNPVNATCLIRLEYDGASVQPLEPAMHDDYAYTAFGGTRNYTEVQGADGTVRGAAAGSLIGRSIEEMGQRTALWVGLTPNPTGVGYSTTIDKLPADNRQLVPVSVNINGIRAQNVPEHIRKAIDTSPVRNSDLLFLKVAGIYPADSVPDFTLAALQKEFYHVILADSTRPDYYLDKLDPRTTEGRFIQFLQDLKVKADSRGGAIAGTEYGAALSSATIEDALYYGLDALNNKKVTVPDVD
jgi:hypothetical protein